MYNGIQGMCIIASKGIYTDNVEWCWGMCNVASNSSYTDIVEGYIGHVFVCLIWFFFSYVGTGLPGFNQYLAGINVSCSRTQRSDAGESRTRGPSVSSQALYHWATALPQDMCIIASKSIYTDNEVWC